MNKTTAHKLQQRLITVLPLLDDAANSIENPEPATVEDVCLKRIRYAQLEVAAVFDLLEAMQEWTLES